MILQRVLTHSDAAIPMIRVKSENKSDGIFIQIAISYFTPLCLHRDVENRCFRWTVSLYPENRHKYFFVRTRNCYQWTEQFMKLIRLDTAMPWRREWKAVWFIRDFSKQLTLCAAADWNPLTASASQLSMLSICYTISALSDLNLAIYCRLPEQCTPLPLANEWWKLQ